jgi:hypothetical protein
VAYKANLGTLLRTYDVVGACMAVPDTEHYWQAVELAEDAIQLPRVGPAWQRTVVLLGHEHHAGFQRWAADRVKPPRCSPLMAISTPLPACWRSISKMACAGSPNTWMRTVASSVSA